MDLCSSCKRFSLHDFRRQPDYTFTSRLSAVEKGAREACALCSFLLSQLQHILLDFTTHPSKTWMRLKAPAISGKAPSDGHGYRLQLHELELFLADTAYETKREYRSPSIFLGLAAEPSSAAAQNGTVIGRYHGDDPTSDGHIAGILEWLSTCLTHPQCSLTASGSSRIDARDIILPTRCIEINRKNLRLRETTGLRGSYVILSHRWREETEVCRTTTVNLGQRRSGRGFGELPGWFQDAITITQRLGIRYIWIDSLCIVQSGDDGVDWMKEAEKMSQYYQNSILTISIVATTSSGSILKPQRHSPFQSLTRVPYIDANNARVGWFYIYNPVKRSLDSFLDEVRGSELLRRGWIFQEWLLSRRTIFYTPNAIYFECQACLPKNERQQELLINIKDDLALQIREQLQGPPNIDTWYYIVELYSNTDLTKPSKDHLLAISGIASEFRETIRALSKPNARVHLQYLSGIWLQDLHHGLLWQTWSPDSQACICGAPSWSWASRLGRVRWLVRNPKTELALKVVALKSNVGISYDMLSLEKWPKCDSELLTSTELPRSSSSEEAAAANDVFDVVSMTTELVLEGQIQPVLVRHIAESEDDPVKQQTLLFETVRILAQETDVVVPKDSDSWQNDPNSLSTFHWRLICSPESPNVIGGWALFDDAAYEKKMNIDEGVIIPALHVLTRKVGQSLFRLTGGDNLRREIYEVLLIDPLPGDQYRRIGVARIFDTNILKAFAISDARHVNLI